MALDDISFHNCEKDYQPPGGEAVLPCHGISLEMNREILWLLLYTNVLKVCKFFNTFIYQEHIKFIKSDSKLLNNSISNKCKFFLNSVTNELQKY